ncbi:MAG: hypothetical protein JOS17DRAFT_821213 [Linnemannia elongata]|nr:MAG: hypothetical protein JOS17DRAFT_821213 [Linnemannia elongata]
MARRPELIHDNEDLRKILKVAKTTSKARLTISLETPSKTFSAWTFKDVCDEYNFSGLSDPGAEVLPPFTDIQSSPSFHNLGGQERETPSFELNCTFASYVLDICIDPTTPPQLLALTFPPPSSSTSEDPKLVLVPGTPSSKLYAIERVAITAAAGSTTEEEVTAKSGHNSFSALLMSTPESLSKSAALRRRTLGPTRRHISFPRVLRGTLHDDSEC